MSKIDVSQWKEFKLSSLFDVTTSKSVDRRYLDFVDDSDAVDFVGRGTLNNGIQGRILPEHVSFKPNSAYTMSLSQIGNNWATWHDAPWFASQNVFVLTPISEKLPGRKARYFIQSVINRNLIMYYNRGYEKYPKQSDIRDMMLILPVDSSGEPDWQYMDSYIAKRAALAHKYVSELAKAKDKPKPLEINGWKEFKLTDLFNVKTGAYLSKHQLKPGSIPRVTVSSVNNGIVGSFERCGLSNERLFSNFLSVNFFGNVFYHDSLCSVDMKVHVLEPKHLYSKGSMLFLVAVLRRKFIIDGYGTYGDQLSSSKLKTDMVYLPVDSSGNPDWQYMNDYVEFMKSIADRHVGSFQSIIKKL